MEMAFANRVKLVININATSYNITNSRLHNKNSNKICLSSTVHTSWSSLTKNHLL